MGLRWDDITMGWVDEEDPIDPYRGWSDPPGSGVEIPELPIDFDERYPMPELPGYDPVTGRPVGGGLTPQPVLGGIKPVLPAPAPKVGVPTVPKEPSIIDKLTGKAFRDPQIPPGFSSGGSGLGRLVIEPVAGKSEQQVLNAIRAMRSQGSWSMTDLVNQLNNPSVAQTIADSYGMNIEDVTNVFRKMLSTGTSGLIMALTGNFPLAAMGYFATDRLLGQPSGVPFQGWPGFGQIDGQPILPMGLTVPEGLPNEIFGDFRFVCCDLLTMKWYPTDEIRPLNYQGQNYRWFCLDRVDGRVYQANWIKKPTIYV